MSAVGQYMLDQVRTIAGSKSQHVVGGEEGYWFISEQTLSVSNLPTRLLPPSLGPAHRSLSRSTPQSWLL